MSDKTWSEIIGNPKERGRGKENFELSLKVKDYKKVSRQYSLVYKEGKYNLEVTEETRHEYFDTEKKEIIKFTKTITLLSTITSRKEEVVRLLCKYLGPRPSSSYFISTSWKD